MLNYGRESADSSHAMVLYLCQQRERDNGVVRQEPAPGGWSYAARMGRETIWLEPIEFAILRFLAASPYRAFSPKKICKEISSRRNPVTPDSLGQHIQSLRQKLGFFADYIQSVPHIGYRFKE